MSISKKDLASERRSRHCRKPQRCVYYAVGSNDGYNGTCDYILITGHRRPCGFGAACTVLVITRDAYNGHIRGVCEACGAKMMG